MMSKNENQIVRKCVLTVIDLRFVSTRIAT